MHAYTAETEKLTAGSTDNIYSSWMITAGTTRVKISPKGLSISTSKWLWCCIMFLKEKAKVKSKRCTSFISHYMKMAELFCFLSEYQNLVNEQIFVFREITVSSLGTSPGVASETPDSYVWEELRTKNHLFMQEACTPTHCIREIQKQESSNSKFLPSPPTVFGVQVA